MMAAKSVVKNVGLVVLLVITMLPEFGGDLLEAIGAEPNETWSKVFNSALLYQPLSQAGPRVPQNRYTRIVTLGEDAEPREIFSDTCRQRLFWAKLIERLNELNPALIVIDRYFTAEGCLNADDIGNRSLRHAILTSSAPVVLGVHTLDRQRMRTILALSPAEKARLKPAALLLEPPLAFEGKVRYGLVRINLDNRKIPMEWPVYKERADIVNEKEAPFPTLSRVAAETREPQLRDDRNLQAILAKGVHPYTGFLRQIARVGAMSVLCGPGFPASGKWQDCPRPPPTSSRPDFSHRIVVVGFSTDEHDLHPSTNGVVPGVVLQANYIESILDDRYLMPMPTWVNVVLNLLALVIIGIMFFQSSRPTGRFARSPNKAAFASMLLAVALWCISYVVALQFGYFMSVWFPGLYVLGLWGHTLGHALFEGHKRAPSSAGGLTT